MLHLVGRWDSNRETVEQSYREDGNSSRNIWNKYTIHFSISLSLFPSMHHLSASPELSGDEAEWVHVIPTLFASGLLSNAL